MINGNLSYKVYFTPLSSDVGATYGSEIDVSDRVFIDGIQSIRTSIDSSDYDIGVFNSGEIELSCWNYNGYFNELDTRSIFMASRDRCKVRIVFENLNITRSGGSISSTDLTETVTFNGIINDEATRLDVPTEKIRFKVLSRDSVLRTTQISGGVVADGNLISEAMFQILNVPRITSVLTISALNINPDLDIVIDVGSAFDDRSVQEALDELLFISNSCMLIDSAGVVTIQSRAEDETADVVNLYGQYDEQKRENIIDITLYNSGKHRNYTSVSINGTTASLSTYVQSFGLRQKTFDIEWITDPTKEETIAERIAQEFKIPKIETHVKIATNLAKTISLLDRVSINYPLRVEPDPGTFLPVIGVTVIGATDQPLPYTFGSVVIDPNMAFKVIEITHNPSTFTSILKLRQTGTEFDDGYFNQPGSCIVGFAIIGDGIICAGGSTCDAFEEAPVGAGQIGCTVIA